MSACKHVFFDARTLIDCYPGEIFMPYKLDEEIHDYDD